MRASLDSAAAAAKPFGSGGGAIKLLLLYSLFGDVGGELMKMELRRRRAREEVGFDGDCGMAGG